MLRHTPIQRHIAAGHQAAVFNQSCDQRVHFEAVWNRGDLFTQAFQLGQIDTGIIRIHPFFAQIARPIIGEHVLVVGQNRGVIVFALIHRFAILFHEFIRFAFFEHALRGQFFSVQSARARMFADGFVHQRLGQCRRVLLVVAEFTETHDVNHHVFFEALAVIQGQLSCPNHHFRIVTVHVQHRRFDHFHHVRAVQSRTFVARIRGGEANLVVNHNMKRAACAVAARLCQIQGFHHHALTGKCGIAMHLHRQNLLTRFIAAAILTRARGAFHHWIDNFQMRRVEREVQMHRTARRGHIAGEALVVFHVTGWQIINVLTLKLGKQIGWIFTQGVDQYVQATAVRHRNDDFLNTLRAAVLDQRVHCGNKALSTFERETFLTDVAGMQIALQTFGFGQLQQNAAFLIHAE